MRNDRLVIAQPEIGQRLYGALAVPQVWEGGLEERARIGIVGEDLTLPEFWFLRGGRSLSLGAAIAAAAGQISSMQLVPDATTQSLFIVDEVWLQNTTSTIQAFAIGFGVPTGIPIIQPVATDDGNPAVVFPGSISAAECRAGSGAVAPSVGNAMQLSLPANSGFQQIKGPWIMRRNTAFIVRSVLTQVSCTLSIRWRERTLLDTERARF